MVKAGRAGRPLFYCTQQRDKLKRGLGADYWERLAAPILNGSRPPFLFGETMAVDTGNGVTGTWKTKRTPLMLDEALEAALARGERCACPSCHACINECDCPESNVYRPQVNDAVLVGRRLARVALIGQDGQAYYVLRLCDGSMIDPKNYFDVPTDAPVVGTYKRLFGFLWYRFVPLKEGKR